MRTLIIFSLALLSITAYSQDQEWKGKFEQLGETLPTPNSYRTGSGAPGAAYWQQQADYEIDVTINDKTQVLTGKEKITYYNNSPNTLEYLWVQLDQNVRENNAFSKQVSSSRIRDSIPVKFFSGTDIYDYEGGYKIYGVNDTRGNALKTMINHTMMRIDLPQPMNTGDRFEFHIEWSYNIYDRMMENGRGGYEFFPEDGNYAYTCAQWYPRMAVYDDYEGWQNKQFIGRGEFALTFGNFKVNITVPSDHIVGATGVLQNARDVLTRQEMERFEQAKTSFDQPVIIVTEKEVKSKEKSHSNKTSTWTFHAQDVRDFAFCSSRKYIWDAQAVKVGDKTPLAMSFYPKEGNPLWEKESTKAVKNTLETYSERTIEYPYPVAISVHAANQGMEYPMICFNYGRPQKNGSYSQRVLEGMVGVIVHEVGHNFFPMIINSDERQWTWMDEGLNSFLERETLRTHYADFDLTWGSPSGMIGYMKGDPKNIRPIMTNSEQITQFGNNAYGKPSAALTLLRETVMGPELFDMAFKTYAERWAFKHPKPADFFRTMEDASGVDLDWFWKGWFYTVDHVDVAVDEVKWFKLRTDQTSLEGQVSTRQESLSSNKKEGEKATDFSKGPDYFSLIETPERYYGEFKARMDDKAVMQKLAEKNFYELKFKNIGGLVTPLIVEFSFTDGTKEMHKIPAEIWRHNETEVTKVFAFEKEVAGIVFDPELATADTNVEDNTFPRKEAPSRFDRFQGKE
ncbi:MAG: M1 family metallopeptidase [Cyclobacteriaceae bacterium]|nr:M1 family metallopeptidase [Cyclobacteriaceae bacterium]